MFYGPEQAVIHDRAFGKLALFAAEDLVELLTSAGLSGGTVVDLGCGSGILARRLVDAGYDVAGVDISPDMVELARGHVPDATFTVGSLYDTSLPAGCIAVAATGESLNYATDLRAGTGALGRLAARIYEALVPGGCWLFDISGPGRAGPTGTTKQFHRHEDWCLGMTSVESEDGGRLDREITIFTAAGNGAYRRTEEHHALRLFHCNQVESMLRQTGFDVEVRTDYRSPPVALDLPGWYVVEARKPAAGEP